MAHEIESMFFTGETPWHGLGKQLDNPPTTAEAIVCAGLDWNVRLDELKTPSGVIVPARATVRESDGQILGVVGLDYTPLQNAEAFGFFDPYVTSGEASLETAGSLREGARVWVLARINRAPSEIVKGDEVLKYVLLSNGHDGTMAVRVGFTPIRVVCANTLAMAHGASASKLIRVRHEGNVTANVEALRGAMDLANASFEATAEQFRRLAAMPINDKDLERYVARVFETPKSAGNVIDLAERRATPRILPQVSEFFAAGRGSELPGVRGTMWGAYNAVTEYLGYAKGGDDAKRLDQVWFGQSATLNRKALDVAIDMAQAA